jgi:hypothetical protein
VPDARDLSTSRNARGAYAPLVGLGETQKGYSSERSGSALPVVYERCCGLAVHNKTVGACVLVTETGGQMQRSIRPFSTMTAGLLAALGLGREHERQRRGSRVNWGVLETGLSSDRRRTNHHSGQC